MAIVIDFLLLCVVCICVHMCFVISSGLFCPDVKIVTMGPSVVVVVVLLLLLLLLPPPPPPQSLV